MPIYIKKDNGNWSTNAKKIFVKWSDGLWKSATRLLAKTANGWVQMWPGDAPANNPNDPVNIRLNSYNGTVASSPQYINTVLYGHDNNGASVIGATPITITNRKMQLATDNSGQTDRYQVESSDIYDLTSNSETDVAEKRFYADGWWLFYQLDATNVWATTRIFSANPIKIIKQAPTFNTGSTNFVEGTGTNPLFTLNFSFSDTWWKSARLYDSYVRWWENTSKSPGGTILKTTYIDDISGLSTTRNGGVYEEYDGQGTTVSGNDYYTAIGGVPAGKYIVAEIVLVNSYTDHYNSTVSTYFSSGDKPLITAISVTDENGNGVMDNQSTPRIMSDGYLYVTATVANAAASTYYLLEPRFYNNNNGNYYRWNSTTLSEYNSWPDDLTPTSSSLSGTTATVTWRIDINADLLYGMGAPTIGTGTSSRWSLEFRVSARASSVSTNASASYFTGIATLGASNVYMQGLDLPAMINIAPSSAMTLNVSSTAAQVNNPVTFSISTNSYPSGYASYPRRYILDFGDGTPPATGTFSTGTSNPSVSNISKTYTSTGSYTATLTWEPQGYKPRSTTSRSITVSPALSPPTSVSVGSVSRLTDSSISASINFSGGSGPYYQLYWVNSATSPVTASYDAASTGSPITDTWTPSNNYTAYFYVRSSSENLGNTTNGGTGTAGLYSAYSSLSPNPSYTFTSPTGGTASISGSTTVGSTLTLSTGSPSASPTADVTIITWRIANGGTGGNSFVGGTVLQNGGYTLTIPSTAAGISTVGYAIRAEVTFNNGVGSQSANSNSLVVTASAVAPSGGSVTLTPSGTQQAGTLISANVTAMSGTSPITYTTSIRKKTGSSPTSVTDGTEVASGSGTGNSVASHTITASEASGTPDQFRAFTTGTNSAGSNIVSSNTVISTPAGSAPTISASVSPTSGTAGSTTYTASSTVTGDPSPTVSYSWQGFVNAGFYWAQVATGTTFSPTAAQQQSYLAWQMVATASNTNGSASSTVSFTVNAAPSGTAPATPTNGGGGYSSGTNYVTNATFTRSASGTTPITYYWSVYAGTSNGFTGGTFWNSGSFSSSTLGGAASIPQQTWNQATYGNWARYEVYASNTVGTSGTLTWWI